MISEGRHNAVAVPVETDSGSVYAQFGVTNNGKNQVVVNFEILDGEDAGQTIAWFGYFATEKNAKKTIESLRNCGFKGDDLAACGDQVLDQRVSLVVEHEEYEGKVKAKVAWVNSSGGGGFRLEKPMADGDRRKFAASMKNLVRGVSEVSGEKGERGRSSADPEDRGDDPMTDTRRDGGGQQRGNVAPQDDSDIPFVYLE